MQNKKNSPSKFFFNISLISLIASTIITASVMSGCSSDNKAENSTATEVVVETQVVTREVDGVYVDENGNILDDQGATTGETIPNAPKDGFSSDSDNAKSESANNSSANNSSSSGNTSSSSSSKSSSSSSKSKNSSGNSDKNAGSATSSKTSSGKSSSSSKTSSNKSSSSSKTSAGANSSSSKTSSSSSNNSSGTLQLGGKTYHVGDTVVCTYNLYLPEDMLNFQGYINYDKNYLKVNKAQLQKPASSGSILNYNLDQEILFNGSSLNGYDYTRPSKFLTVEYEVVGTGSTNPTLTWEVVTGISNKKYASSGKLINHASTTASYKAQ